MESFLASVVLRHLIVLFIIVSVFCEEQPNKVVDRCNPSPCGINTNCYLDKPTGRPVCICKPKYKGSPLEACYAVPEPEVDPCLNACAAYAHCEVKDKEPVCTCPPDYFGDGVTICMPECTSQIDCPANSACIGNKCGDPCLATPNPCGKNAQCRVQDHKAICKCPKGYKGHPFEECLKQ